MAASIATIKAGQAKALADYYANKASERVADLAMDPEHADKSADELMMLARIQVAREEAMHDGRDPDRAEVKERAAIASDRVAGATAYYAADDADPDGRRVWIRGDRAGEAITGTQLEALFLGADEAGQNLGDPAPQEIKKAAKLAGYTGEITPNVLASMRAGLHPETGAELTGDAADYARQVWAAPERNENAVTAFDTTLSAPKGVSLLAAFCDDRTAEAVIRAHQEAAAQALDWAQENGAVVARRGKDGVVHQAAELTEAAQITEMTSRAGDPQLHTHTLVSAYVVSNEDGRRTTMDSQAWHGASAAINASYLRALDANLRQEVGVGLELDEKGQRTVVPGIAPQLIERYSSRRNAINETITERTQEKERLEQVMGSARHLFKESHQALEAGEALTDAETRRAEVYGQWLDSGTTPQAAALDTRVSKAEEPEHVARERWAADPTTPDGARLLGGAQAATQQAQHAPVAEWGEVEQARFTAELAEHLTKDAAAFSTKEAHAAALHLAPTGVSTSEIAETVDDYLTRGAVLMQEREEAERVGDRWAEKTRRFTTSEIVQEQQHIVATGQQLADDTVPAIRETNLRAAATVVNSHRVSEDQEQLVGAYLTGQRLITCDGPAGGGKSRVAETIAELAHGAGAQVTVLSTQTDTAADLAAEIGADRAMSFQKATMRAADEDNPHHSKGVFESGYWGQGLTAEQADDYHTIRMHQREAKTDRQREKAEREMARWVESLPTKADAKLTQQTRSHVEQMDKLARWTDIGDRSELHQWRTQLIAEAAEQPETVVKIDHDRPQVIIVDEAAMTNNQHLGRLLDYAREHRNVQLVMVGDTAQLGGIGRSGAYRALLDEVQPVQLAETRRARQEWEREAQLSMRGLDYTDTAETHDAARALVDTYRAQGRVGHIGDEDVSRAIADGRAEASDKRADMDLAAEQAADWYMSRRGDQDTLVLTATRAQQVQVAQRIQERRIADPDDKAMRADAKTATLDLGEGQTQQAQKGEPVMVRQNDTRRGLRNGMTGEVVAVSARGGVTVQMTDERGRTFKTSMTRKDLNEGKLSLAYSSTSHKAQGATVDRALYIHDAKSPHVDRHMVYPSVSRGRQENRILVVGGADETEAAESLATAMHRSNTAEPVRVVSQPVSDAEREWVAKRHPSLPREQQDEMALRMRERDQRHARDDARDRQIAQRRQTQQLAQERDRVQSRRRGLGRGRAA
ncbi:MobF family relaxase [Micrococcaceae sp. AOP34-BR2-30]|uniref:MobF family relaxase n=1 Tax=Microbacteriaceae TaxID=85023 RepID=UPI00159568F0|nr:MULTISPECIES: MobF family relaxase [Microbacteriaceae]MDA3146026.1 relaxase domain-containing protein [Leucobacter sp. UCMA 4100]